MALNNEQPDKMRLPEIRDVRETLRVPLEGYGLCLAMSQGGKYIALGGMVPSQYGLIHLFDSTGKQLWRHKTREAISAVTISRSGEFLAAASDDNNIYFFDRRGLLQWRHETSRLIKGLAISAAGDFLAAGSEDSNLYFFDKNRAIKKFVWKHRFEGSVTSVDMSLTGRHIVAGSADRTAAFFDGSGELLWSYEAGDSVNAVRLSADGGLVAAGSSDNKLYLFSGTGTLQRSIDCGAPVNALCVSSRGDIAVAAAGRELVCLDAQGVRLWSLSLGSNIIRMAASDLADAILVATDDKSLHLVTRPGALVWKYTSSGGVYGLGLSDDRELALTCGPSELLHFENSKIFRELVARHQLALTAMKREGQDASGSEASLKQAVSVLTTRNYPAVAESLKEVQDSMGAMDRISHERDKLRADTAEALDGLRAAIDQLKLEATTPAASEEPQAQHLRELASRAEQSFRTGKYSEALGEISRAEETVQSIRGNRSGRVEIQRMVESLAAQIQAAKKLDVDTSPADAHLERASNHLHAGNLPSASDEALEAARVLSSAKAASPKAIEAEFTRACRILGSPAATDADLKLAEEGITSAIGHLVGKKDFTTLAENLEKLAASWAKRPRSPASIEGHQNAVLMAIGAHRDAGKLDRAVELAKQAGDWTTAAKLLLTAGDKTRADDAWTRAATAKKPKPQIPEELRARAEAFLSKGRFCDAAAELARAGFVFEASKVLSRGPPDARNTALMMRLLHHLQDVPGMLEKARASIPALKKAAKESGDSRDLAAYGHMLVGALELATLLDSPETHTLHSELQEFAHDYSRALARDEIRASEVCDLTVLYAYLLERNWKAVERLAELKGGPTWDHLKGALGAWRDVNIYLFREETGAFLLSRPGPYRYPTQSLPEVVGPENLHDGLNALAPFNHLVAVHHLLDKLSNNDYLTSIVKRADAEMAAGREERGAALYESALAMDTFGLLDSKKIHLRAAGYLLSQRRESEAVPHLEAARAGREAALTEYRNLRGLAAAPARKPATVAKAAPGAQSGKAACPRCGSPVPAKAIRCFRCGKSLK